MLSMLSIGAWADDTYEDLDFIDCSTSDRTKQYFNTNVGVDANTQVEIKFQAYRRGVWRAIFSARNSNTTGISLYVNGSSDNLGYFVGGNGGSGDAFAGLTFYQDHVVTADLENFTLDGTTKSTGRTTWQSTDKKLTLFSNPDGDASFLGRIYYVKVKNKSTGNTLHNFVPVLKNGTTPCFHCTVCGNYIEPASGGEFGWKIKDWSDEGLTYTQVSYIDYNSTSSEDTRTRVFDTGYVPNENTKIVTKFKCHTVTAWGAIFSGRNGGANNTGISLYRNGDNTHLGYFVGSLGSGGDTFADCETDVDCIVEASLEKLVVNGTPKSTGQSTWNATTRSITLFANPEWDSSFKGTIYYFKIYEGDNLLHNFIPVKASDGTKGFYDTIDKKYITTRTTSDHNFFTAGSEVGEFWDGKSDSILPSIKYGGSYSAYTWAKQSSDDFGSWVRNNVHYNAIQGLPNEDTNGKKWYENGYLMPTTNEIDWTYGSSVLPNSWTAGEKYGDVYVRRNFIVNNTLPATIYMPTPHDDAPCEYYINGTCVWSRTGNESVDGWNEGEVVRLTAEQKALIHTDGTINVFAFHVHQNWGGKYADGGLYGDAQTAGSPSKTFEGNSNHKILTELMPWAESEGLEQSAIDYAKDRLNYLQEAGLAIDKIRVARKVKAADKHENVFSKETVPANDKYVYLYNVGQKRFFCGGDDWCTHAAVGFPGIKVLLCEQDGSSYRIDTRLLNPNNDEKDKHFLGYNGYCDTNSSVKWTFTRNADDTYAIARADDTSQLLGYTPGTFCRVDPDRSGADDSNNKWILVTEEERNELLQSASLDNPVDASYKIRMPNFNQREYEIVGGWVNNSPNGAWTRTSTGANTPGIWERGSNHTDYVFESWNATTTELSQNISGLLPGKYKLSVQGYYRHGNYEQQVLDYQNNSVKTDGAYLYAKGEDNPTMYLKPITDEKDKAPGEGKEGDIGRFPDGCDMAATYFEYGLYKNELEVFVGSDGNLEIGVVQNDNEIEKDWVVVDNFRLTYLGGPITLSENEDNSGINKSTYKVTLTRSLKADKWNTFCVPFAMTTAQITDQLGDGVEVKELTRADKTGDHYTLTFTDASSIEAGKPYMVKVANNVSSIELTNASGIAVNTTDTPSVTEDGVTFTGVYTSGYAPLNSFIISNNVFYLVDTDEDGDEESEVALKAFRGYITVPASPGVKALNFTFEDDATSINSLTPALSEGEGAIYNLAGQMVNGKLPKGIYIVNGKKVLK